MTTAVQNDLSPYFETLATFQRDYGSTWDWSLVFGNTQPVEIDVGSGRGLFLVTAGERFPETNFLGIELEYTEGRRAAKRLKKREFRQVRVLGGSVFDAFAQHVAPHSVEAVHVYFPDPWWKRKHRQRRVFNDHFVELCARVLKPNGMLHSWTDVSEYFDVISALMNHHALFTPLSPAARLARHDLDYQTSYERKKRQAGLPIYRGRWQRKELT